MIYYVCIGTWSGIIAATTVMIVHVYIIVAVDAAVFCCYLSCEQLYALFSYAGRGTIAVLRGCVGALSTYVSLLLDIL